jgi:hypothetical protein
VPIDDLVVLWLKLVLGQVPPCETTGDVELFIVIDDISVNPWRKGLKARPHIRNPGLRLGASHTEYLNQTVLNDSPVPARIKL